jgi:hypothetical protein
LVAAGAFLFQSLDEARKRTMPNDRRITIKLLGAIMETLNISPVEFRKTMWHAGWIAAMLILIWRLPEIIAALAR